MENLSHWLTQVTLHKKDDRGDSVFMKVIISKTSHYPGGFFGTDAVFLEMIRLWLHFSNIDKEVVVATKSVCAHDILPAWLCATFGSCALLAAYI